MWLHNQCHVGLDVKAMSFKTEDWLMDWYSWNFGPPCVKVLLKDSLQGVQQWGVCYYLLCSLYLAELYCAAACFFGLDLRATFDLRNDLIRDSKRQLKHWQYMSNSQWIKVRPVPELGTMETSCIFNDVNTNYTGTSCLHQSLASKQHRGD